MNIPVFAIGQNLCRFPAFVCFLVFAVFLFPAIAGDQPVFRIVGDANARITSVDPRTGLLQWSGVSIGNDYAVECAPTLMSGTWHPIRRGQVTQTTMSSDVRSYMIVDLLASAVSSSATPPADLHSNPVYKSTRLVLGLIPSGDRMLGSPPGEPGHNPFFECLHHVELTGNYFMSVFEITQKQWETVMGANPSFNTADDHPVESVTWEEIRSGFWPIDFLIP
jgi:hypothetical protein